MNSVDWSKESVNLLKTQTIADRKLKEGKKPKKGDDKKIASRFQGSEFYFNIGITFSPTGIYSPSFRISTGNVFESKGSCIFAKEYEIEEVLGLLASKFAKFVFKNYISHGVETGEGAIGEFIYISCPESILILVKSIIRNQKENLNYDYMTNEQLKIDRLVYAMYNLNEKDIQEVENWYFRRYPKLARVIEEKIKNKETTDYTDWH